MSSLYETLNVPPNASQDEIKKSYRKLSMEWHPDRNASANATAKFQEINKAYDVLGDPAQRQQYDMTGGMGGDMHPGMGGNVFFNEFPGDVGDDLFNMFSHMFPPGGMQGGIHVGRASHGMPHMFTSHIFNGTPTSMKQLLKPAPIEITLELDISQIFSDCTRSITISRCETEGENATKKEEETIYITIPKGSDDGEIIVVEEKGNISMEGVRGDIKIFLKIINNTSYVRDGLDLIYKKDITLKDALCGFSCDVEHINGQSFKINKGINNIITPGYRKVVPKRGIQRGDTVGNLIIEFNILFPNKLEEDTVNKLRDIL